MVGGFSHTHRCLRCGEEFDCPQQPGDCAAGYDVMPDIIIRSGRTFDTYVHCPQLEPGGGGPGGSVG